MNNRWVRRCFGEAKLKEEEKEKSKKARISGEKVKSIDRCHCPRRAFSMLPGYHFDLSL